MDGQESVEDRKHSGRPSTCTTPEMNAKVREVILEDRRQTPVERAALRFHWRDPSRVPTGTEHAYAGRLQRVLPKMAKSLGSLYTSPRWRWKLGLKVSIHVITSKFSEILGSPSYVCLGDSHSTSDKTCFNSIVCFGLNFLAYSAGSKKVVAM